MQSTPRSIHELLASPVLARTARINDLFAFAKSGSQLAEKIKGIFAYDAIRAKNRRNHSGIGISNRAGIATAIPDIS
jgi:hypothetical protein